VQNTRAQVPTLPVDEKAAATGKGKETEKKKPEENQLAKSVKDRSVHRMYLTSICADPIVLQHKNRGGGAARADRPGDQGRHLLPPARGRRNSARGTRGRCHRHDDVRMILHCID
jgi:hypothetical protein